MKVTALIPEKIISETKRYSGGKNITESLLIALEYYISRQRLRRAIEKVESAPFEFRKGYSAAKVRRANRQG